MALRDRYVTVNGIQFGYRNRWGTKRRYAEDVGKLASSVDAAAQLAYYRLTADFLEKTVFDWGGCTLDDMDESDVMELVQAILGNREDGELPNGSENTASAPPDTTPPEGEQ